MSKTVTCILAIFLLGNASNGMSVEISGSIDSGIYTSPQKVLQCSLPLLDSTESFKENYIPLNEGISASNDNGDIAQFNRTQWGAGTGHGKYVKASMSANEKLMSVEKYWNETHYDLFVLSNTKKESIKLDGIKFRLFITDTSIDDEKQHFTSEAKLYTTVGQSLIMYIYKTFDKIDSGELRERILSLHQKCSFKINKDS